jgi:putative membrane protein
MTTLHFLTSYGELNFTAIVIAVLLVFLHLRTNVLLAKAGTFLKFSRRSPIFFTGVLLLLIVMLSPLYTIGHYYLFSVHMVSHVLSLLVIPPLLVNGMSPQFWERMVQNRIFQKIGNILFKPSVSWMFGVGSMWILHIPAVYTFLGRSQALMNFQMILLLIFGTIFIWPIYAPVRWKKLSALESAVYLFTACVGCTVLGIFITFTPFSLYGSCMTGQDPALLSLIRLNWGITPDIDQQIGGLIMWVPACIIYLTNIIVIMIKWFSASETEEVDPVVINGKQVD